MTGSNDTKVKNYIEQGFSVNQIALKMGYSHQWVRDILRKLPTEIQARARQNGKANQKNTRKYFNPV